jgi:NADH:ubiquinone reductase (H+-translocating)
MFRQIKRRLRGQPLLPYTYRDFGSLVSLGKWTTVGNLMGFLVGRGFFALGGTRRALLETISRARSRIILGRG